MGLLKVICDEWKKKPIVGHFAEINRRLSTDAGKYELKSWLEDYPERRLGHAMIRRFEVRRCSPEGKVHLLAHGAWHPLDDKFVGEELRCLIPEQDIYKLGSILVAMLKKMEWSLVDQVAKENPVKFFKDLAVTTFKGIFVRVRG